MPETPKPSLWLAEIPNGFAARFIYDPAFLRKDGTINARAFIPCAVNGVWESSVCLHDMLGEHAVAQIGRSIGEKRKRPLAGWADFPVADVPGVTHSRLRLEAAPSKGNPRHANILGWGDRADHLMLATRLAEISRAYRAR